VDSTYDPLIRSWTLYLAAANKAPKTIEAYGTAARLLAAHLGARGRGDGWEHVVTADVHLFLQEQLTTHAPSTTHQRYRGFKWLLAEGEIRRDPMTGVAPPEVPEQPVDVPASDVVAKLVRGLAGTDFESRRDLAIFSLLVDTGMRRAEIAGIEVEHLDLDHREVEVLGKGRRARTLRYGRQTALALDRYLRIRAKHRMAGRPELWLAVKNRPPMKANGIYQMVRRRGEAAGLDGLHPHQLRHLFAHLWLDKGGSEGHLMAIAGWRSRSMVTRYADSTRAARARDEADRLGILDRLT